MSVWRSDHDRDHRPVSQVSSGESSAVTAAADNCSTVCTLATHTLRSPDLPSSTVLCAAIHRWPGSEESCCVECSLRCSWSGGVGPVKWWSVTKQVLMSEHSDPALCPSVCCSSTLASHLHCRTRPADPAPRSTGEWRVRECSFLHPPEIATHAHKSCKSQPTTTVRDHQGELTVIIPLLLISRKWIASCHSTTRSQNSSSTRVSPQKTLTEWKCDFHWTVLHDWFGLALIYMDQWQCLKKISQPEIIAYMIFIGQYVISVVYMIFIGRYNS